jgi:hypothetical protein
MLKARCPSCSKEIPWIGLNRVLTGYTLKANYFCPSCKIELIEELPKIVSIVNAIAFFFIFLLVARQCLEIRNQLDQLFYLAALIFLALHLFLYLKLRSYRVIK